MQEPEKLKIEVRITGQVLGSLSAHAHLMKEFSLLTEEEYNRVIDTIEIVGLMHGYDYEVIIEHHEESLKSIMRLSSLEKYN